MSRNQRRVIRGEEDLEFVERCLDGTGPVNARLSQIPGLLDALRRAWSDNIRLRRENTRLRRENNESRTEAA